ncbi:MAG: hypothetical protein J6R32_08500 [Bacteroidales bacterium]|nr:hypothetical protein [Bacteroidales bacterium]
MGVHLYTNGAWTDGGKIYRNSLNLYNKTDLSIAVGQRYITVQQSLNPGLYAISFDFISDNTGDNSIILYNSGSIVVNVSVPAAALRRSIVVNTNNQYIDEIRFYSAVGYTPSESYYAEIKNIMINSGNKKLPYEPYNIIDWYTNTGHDYSSGAWD